jgi:hypothetical protein
VALPGEQRLVVRVGRCWLQCTAKRRWSFGVFLRYFPFRTAFPAVMNRRLGFQAIRSANPSRWAGQAPRLPASVLALLAAGRQWELRLQRRCPKNKIGGLQLLASGPRLAASCKVEPSDRRFSFLTFNRAMELCPPPSLPNLEPVCLLFASHPFSGSRDFSSGDSFSQQPRALSIAFSFAQTKRNLLFILPTPRPKNHHCHRHCSSSCQYRSFTFAQ